VETLIEIKYGSHLYGTTTIDSDLDIKGIFIPSARDIILQKIPPIISQIRMKSHGEKNTANDIDYELYNPQKYLSLLAQGQMVALDMLFAPDFAMLKPPHPKWNAVKAIAPKILTKQAASFVNYCKQQANKYSVKGTRIAAARHTFEVLIQLEERYGPSEKLSIAENDLRLLAKNNKFIFVGQITLVNGSEELYLELCGKKALFNASIKSARLIAQKIIDEYGQRACEAERNEGVDWKALLHAVRVGRQALEFFKYQHITFPRPEATHLLAIKQGKIAFQQVSEEIEQLVIDVEAAAQRSNLPETYDQQLIDDFIEQLYLGQVLKEFEHGI
jgi:hypothetical protein